MRTSGYAEEFEHCRSMVEAALARCFMEQVPQIELLEAMRYSLLAGGKRIRPILLLQFCRAAGGEVEKALPLACSVEMLHTYSLIHDDLPCMDDDELRRGKPTNHMVYGVCTATLAGDALQAAAFRNLLQAGLPADVIAEAGALLADAAGEHGICGGQYLDMKAEGRILTIEELTLVHNLKTASMLRAAAEMGVVAAGAGESQRQAASAYAEALGLAFQVRDDILDCTATTQMLGKPAGSDAARGKNTFSSLLGIPACEEMIRNKTDEAKAAVYGKFPDTGFLEWIADWLSGRNN